jgi:hypothetical protein
MLFLRGFGLRLELVFILGDRVIFRVKVLGLRLGVRENKILNGTEFCVPTRLVIQDCVCVRTRFHVHILSFFCLGSTILLSVPLFMQSDGWQCLLTVSLHSHIHCVRTFST